MSRRTLDSDTAIALLFKRFTCQVHYKLETCTAKDAKRYGSQSHA